MSLVVFMWKTAASIKITNGNQFFRSDYDNVLYQIYLLFVQDNANIFSDEKLGKLYPWNLLKGSVEICCWNDLATETGFS